MKKAVLLLLALALAAAAAAAPVELGQTADQVQVALGRPDLKSVYVEPGRDVEVWSYDQPYRWFWLECDQCSPETAGGRAADTQPLACRERARVVFVNGRVAAYLARD